MSRTSCARKSYVNIATIVGLGALGALAVNANAALITFDPDGGGGGNAPTPINGLDWSVGNSLATNRLPVTVGSTFQQYYHSTLAGVINSNGTTVAPTGLNSTFELTAVGSATHIVTNVSIIGGVTTVSTQLAPVQSANSFFEIWFDSTPDANSLAGTGFNDGQRILLGSPNPARPSSSTYANAVSGGGGPIVESFDEFGTDNYPNTNTITGAGGWIYDASISSANPAFFIDPVGSMSFNTSLITPFRETDPSGLFANLPNGGAPTIVPNIGAINGATGPDFQFQADANSTFVVPEPIGAGWGMLGLSALVMRKRVAR